MVLTRSRARAKNGGVQPETLESIPPETLDNIQPENIDDIQNEEEDVRPQAPYFRLEGFRQEYVVGRTRKRRRGEGGGLKPKNLDRVRKERECSGLEQWHGRPDDLQREDVAVRTRSHGEVDGEGLKQNLDRIQKKRERSGLELLHSRPDDLQREDTVVQPRSYGKVEGECLKPKKRSRKQKERLKPDQSVAASGVQVRKAHRHLLEVKATRKARAQRLQQEILGSNSTFPGRISIPGGREARANDRARLRDIKSAIQKGVAVVYWADGSHGGSGFLGAGVAWKGDKTFWYRTYQLGRYTGDSLDAELFAIAAALGRAKKEVERNQTVQLVRIYTDAMAILQKLAKAYNSPIGPMINSKTALQGVYERAEWLKAKGIKLELIWVKAHANSEGNRWADKAAAEAVSKQIALLQQGNHGGSMKERESIMTRDDVPSMWNQLGSDWANEWLSRANAHIS